MTSITKRQDVAPYPLLESLELAGAGVAVESYRNHPAYPEVDLWQAVLQNESRYLILQEPGFYQQTFSDAEIVAARRARHAMETCLTHFMDSYPLPLLVAGAAANIPDSDAARQSARVALAGSFVTPPKGGAITSPGIFTRCPDLHFQRGQVLRTYLNNQPDLMWDILFHTLETHADAPVIGMAARDGIVARASHLIDTDRAAFDGLFKDATRPKLPGVLSDSCTLLTLVNRARVDALRPFATPGHMYDRMQTIPHQSAICRTSASCFDGWRPGASQRQPTRYLQQPWTEFQLAQFDSLPCLGTLYRPQVASYWAEGDQLVDLAGRQLRFDVALQAALAPLDGQLPARVFFDYGSVWNSRAGGAQFGRLSSSLAALHPDFDLYQPQCGIDLAQSLGDLGAGSPFVAVALASMAGVQSGGATLIANLRRKEGATLMLVRPPSDEQRKRDATMIRPLQPRFHNK